MYNSSCVLREHMARTGRGGHGDTASSVWVTRRSNPHTPPTISWAARGSVRKRSDEPGRSSQREIIQLHNDLQTIGEFCDNVNSVPM